MKVNKWRILYTTCFLILLFLNYRAVQSRYDLDQKIIQDLIEQRKELEKIVSNNEEEIENLERSFTYLDDFTDEERTKYKTFYETKDSKDLSLSPEKTLLVYLHAASNYDIEALHALTHTPQNLEEFADDYRTNGRQSKDLESVIIFRYYDYVKTLEGEAPDTDTLIEISVSQSHTQFANIYSLKRDSDGWKLDFLPAE